MQKEPLTEEQRLANRRASKLAYYYRNKEKHAEYAAKYHREHREARSEKSKFYEEKNKERRSTQKKIYRVENKAREAARYQENKNAVSAQCAKYYEKNAEEIKARVRAYRLANPDWALTMSRNKRAQKKAVGGKLSKGLAATLMALQKGKCACCRVDLRNVAFHIDHVMPISRGGSNTDDNTQLLCKDCNLSKHAKHPVDFMQSRGFLL